MRRASRRTICSQWRTLNPRLSGKAVEDVGDTAAERLECLWADARLLIVWHR